MSYPAPGYGPPWQQQPVYPVAAGQDGPPGSVTAARTILWIQGAFWALSGIALLVLGIVDLSGHNLTSEGDSASQTGYAFGTLLPGAFCGALAIFILTIAGKLRAGGSGTRICALLVEGFLIFLGVLGLAGAVVVVMLNPVPWAVLLIVAVLLWLVFPGAVFFALLTDRARAYLTRRG